MLSYLKFCLFNLMVQFRIQSLLANFLFKIKRYQHGIWIWYKPEAVNWGVLQIICSAGRISGWFNYFYHSFSCRTHQNSARELRNEENGSRISQVFLQNISSSARQMEIGKLYEKFLCSEHLQVIIYILTVQLLKLFFLLFVHFQVVFALFLRKKIHQIFRICLKYREICLKVFPLKHLGINVQ